MPRLKRALAHAELPPRGRNEDSIYLNMAETLQLGYRNYRIDLSEDEWAKLRGGVHSLGLTCEKETEKHEYRMGNPLFLVALNYNEKVSADSYIYRNRFAVEEQDDGTIHIHYRDLRIRVSPDELRDMTQAMVQACETYCTPNAHFPVAEPVRQTKTVPIEAITPHNALHPIGMDESKGTHDAISYARRILERGGRLRPILVDENGVILDGFVRYCALMFSGAKEIEVIIDPFAQINGQIGQTMEASDEEA